MTQATIRSRLATILNTVSDVGVVHDYERWNADWSKFLDLFKTTISGTDQIRGAMVMYRGFIPGVEDLTTCSVPRNHNFVIVYIQGLKDADETEKEASEMAETIVDAIDTDATLNGSSYIGFNPSQVETFEQRIFGDVLCHYAEIRKIVAEEFTWAS